MAKVNTILIQQNVANWFEALQTLGQYSPKMKNEEHTIVEFLKDYWRNYANVGDDEGDCARHLDALKKFYNTHPDCQQIVDQYKTLVGVANKMFLKDNDTFHEFKKLAAEYVKTHKPKPTVQPTPQPKPEEVSMDLSDLYETCRSVYNTGGDMNAAYQGFLLCAENGIYDAYFFLAVMEQNGNIGTPNKTKAFQYFKAGAEGGNAMCMAYLGLCYHQGDGTTVNISLAEQWYERAVAKGLTVGKHFLAEFLLEREKTPERMFKLFEAVAKDSDSGLRGLAQLRIGFCYEWGLGVRTDMNRARNIYLQEKQKGTLLADDYLKQWNEHNALLNDNRTDTSQPQPKPTTQPKPTMQPRQPKPATTTTTTSTTTNGINAGDDSNDSNGCLGCGCLTLIAAIIAFFWFDGCSSIKDWFSSSDDNSPTADLYVLVESLNMRAAPNPDGQIIGSVGYGEKMGTNDLLGQTEWVKVKSSGNEGYVARAFVGTLDEMTALNDLWGGEGSRQTITDIRHRRALIAFIRERLRSDDYRSDGGYKLYASGNNSGNIWRHKSLGGNGVFAFILEKNNGGRVAAVCAYNNQNQPVITCVTNMVNDNDYIETVEVRRGTISLNLSSKGKKKGKAKPRVQEATEVIPTAPTREELKARKAEEKQAETPDETPVSTGFHFEKIE